ncbi:hydantoinase/oxoprolinase family protein [Roseomonas sp. AR75]|uniref:hydantoinase/oxoprolinase family protein n=1 Tax=Roseomonas sp. AR75 TaxID=2562311 RepID=UPI0010BFAF0D|nr:hydantoinase/oxoprolinase family protein [Roseomonas sp. AR75]
MAEPARAPAALRIGVDTGGTFTDVCLYDPATGALSVWKLSSTAHDPSEAIVAGIVQGLSGNGHAGADVAYVGHGTTVATNALIQGRLARAGMITTAGFRDVIEIRRQTRPALYDLQVEKPRPPASRDLRLEVPERIRFDGSVAAPLDADALRTAARRLREAGVDAVAICFLFAHLAPAHEQQALAILREELPDAFLCASHEVAPEYREYERFSTTTLNAALGPVMRFYLGRLAPRLRAAGITHAPHLTQSNGGVISSEAAARLPVRTVLSGPAAGVMGAIALGTVAGLPDIITFDMGGTSTDVSLINGGRAVMATEAEVHGHALKVSMLDIHTVGAGGGSIARVDAGGHLKVGPASAGADPGPVCYGLGNEEPTVTDANVVLGIQNPTHLLGGRMSIDRAAAERAIARLADRLGLDTMRTAQGILSVVTANMAKAIRVISVERGHDPRDYVLMAFGGAGPVHAARLARELEIRRVLVPRSPGILCAMGLLLTDLRTDFAAGRMVPLAPASLPGLGDGFAALQAQAESWFEGEHIAPADRATARRADMRYEGQAHELTIACPDGALDDVALASLRQGFEEAHRQVYGYIAPEEPIRIVALRLEATGCVPKAALPVHPPATTPVADAHIGTREAWLPEAGGAVACALYDRAGLGPGHRIPGPAIVEQMDSTTLILPGQSALVDPWLNLLVEEDAA